MSETLVKYKVTTPEGFEIVDADRWSADQGQLKLEVNWKMQHLYAKGFWLKVERID